MEISPSYLHFVKCYFDMLLRLFFDVCSELGSHTSTLPHIRIRDIDLREAVDNFSYLPQRSAKALGKSRFKRFLPVMACEHWRQLPSAAPLGMTVKDPTVSCLSRTFGSCVCPLGLELQHDDHDTLTCPACFSLLSSIRMKHSYLRLTAFV